MYQMKKIIALTNSTVNLYKEVLYFFSNFGEPKDTTQIPWKYRIISQRITQKIAEQRTKQQMNEREEL